MSHFLILDSKSLDEFRDESNAIQKLVNKFIHRDN